MAGHFATSLKLDASLKERVHRLAQARFRSPHWLMCEAIRDFVDREEQREQRAHASTEAAPAHADAASAVASTDSSS